MKILLILALIFSSSLYAQDNGDFFEDDFEDPYIDPNMNMQQPEISSPAFDSGSRFNIPGNPTNFGSSASGMTNNFGGSTSSSGFSGSDQIQFRLVDPPKYWQPKKRLFRSPIGRTSK